MSFIAFVALCLLSYSSRNWWPCPCRWACPFLCLAHLSLNTIKRRACLSCLSLRLSRTIGGVLLPTPLSLFVPLYFSRSIGGSLQFFSQILGLLPPDSWGMGSCHSQDNGSHRFVPPIVSYCLRACLLVVAWLLVGCDGGVCSYLFVITSLSTVTCSRHVTIMFYVGPRCLGFPVVHFCEIFIYISYSYHINCNLVFHHCVCILGLDGQPVGGMSRCFV